MNYFLLRRLRRGFNARILLIMASFVCTLGCAFRFRNRQKSSKQTKHVQKLFPKINLQFGFRTQHRLLSLTAALRNDNVVELLELLLGTEHGTQLRTNNNG